MSYPIPIQPSDQPYPLISISASNMLPNPKILPIFRHPPIKCVPTSTSTSTKLLRRELTILGNSSLLLLSASHQSLRAEEAPPTNTQLTCIDPIPTSQAFLDISIDGEPVGRILIGLYGDDAPVGAARFASLVSGAAGFSYRRKEFVKIMATYVQNGGVRSFGEGGTTGSGLVEEWERQRERCPGITNLAGSVGLIVRDPSKPPPKMKLVARQGKLQIDEEEVGIQPNGTEFVITNQDSPDLDASVLVIGRVVGGMEVVDRIRLVKTVQENSSSPYFKVAKLIGDKRAVVAERGFNRPYSKVQITNCGFID